MKMRPFSVGETVFGIRDLELSDKAVVLGYEESERGFVLVRFGDGIPRTIPVASLVRAANKKAEPRFASKALAESATLGDYIIRVESEFANKGETK